MKMQNFVAFQKAVIQRLLLKRNFLKLAHPNQMISLAPWSIEDRKVLSHFRTKHGITVCTTHSIDVKDEHSYDLIVQID